MRNFDNVTCEKCSVFLAYTQIAFFNETSTMSTRTNLLDKVNYLGKQSAVKRRCLLGCGEKGGWGWKGAWLPPTPSQVSENNENECVFNKYTIKVCMSSF